MEENFVLDEDLKERVEKTKKCAMYGMMLLIGGIVFAVIISLINSLLNWHFLEELSLFSVMATYVAAWVVGVRFKAVKITFKVYVRLWLRLYEIWDSFKVFLAVLLPIPYLWVLFWWIFLMVVFGYWGCALYLFIVSPSISYLIAFLYYRHMFKTYGTLI